MSENTDATRIKELIETVTRQGEELAELRSLVQAFGTRRSNTDREQESDCVEYNRKQKGTT
jgi:hypothetical protein